MDQPHLLRLIPGLFSSDLLFRLGLSEGRGQQTDIALKDQRQGQKKKKRGDKGGKGFGLSHWASGKVR